MNAAAPSLFPLIRHASRRVTPLLLALSLTPNQVTAASMLLGLGAAFCFSLGIWSWGLVGALAFVAAYILDNCDGEVARARNMCSEFGRKFDSFVDWLVHMLAFAAMGYGGFVATGQVFWLWMGGVAAAGVAINDLVVLLLERGEETPVEEEAETQMPDRWLDRVVFVFRELFRADFWLVVALLALFDWLRFLLLPAAIGAHVYWLLAIIGRARRYRV